MTNEQAIRAGLMAVTRRDLRAIAHDRVAITITCKTADGKTRTVALDAAASRAAINGADLNLSDRLGKLGVSELCD